MPWEKDCIICGKKFIAYREDRQKCGTSSCYANKRFRERIAAGQCKWCAAPIADDRKVRTCDRCKQRAADYAREHSRKVKLEVIAAYGYKCVCCGESEPKFLSIDHIFNDGAEHRRQLVEQGVLKKAPYGHIMYGSDKMYRWLKRQGYPKDRFQLLCYNCNCAKGFWGKCPHQA